MNVSKHAFLLNLLFQIHIVNTEFSREWEWFMRIYERILLSLLSLLLLLLLLLPELKYLRDAVLKRKKIRSLWAYKSVSSFDFLTRTKAHENSKRNLCEAWFWDMCQGHLLFLKII